MAFKRVATEGATIDNREITREMIEQMAATYDPNKYGARIFLEHMRGMIPDGPFKAYGDVRAVKMSENANGRLELFADIDPTPELKAMVKARQKVYTSIEVEPNFAKTGSAYLTGLGVTDSPASLGTEMLAFSAKRPADSILACQPPSETMLCSEGVELSDLDVDDHDFSDETAGQSEEHKLNLSERIKALFKRSESRAVAGDNALAEEVEAGMSIFAERHESLAKRVAELPSKDEFSQLAARVEQIYTALDNIPDTPPRSPATGGTDGTLTDC